MAFDGFFVFPRDVIIALRLRQEAATQAILADGSEVTLESFVCYVNWFGVIIVAQVIANEGKLPLLGTEFLANRRLVVDYVDKTVTIE
jgi:predicted aspartyl protease